MGFGGTATTHQGDRRSARSCAATRRSPRTKEHSSYAAGTSPLLRRRLSRPPTLRPARHRAHPLRPPLQQELQKLPDVSHPRASAVVARGVGAAARRAVGPGSAVQPLFEPFGAFLNTARVAGGGGGGGGHQRDRPAGAADRGEVFVG